MKIFQKLLILVIVLVTACSEDQQDPKYSTEILQNYNWELVSRSNGDGRIVAVIGQPFPTLRIEHDVIAFLGVSDGTLFKVVGSANMILGNWEVDGKNLTLNGNPVKITKLTSKELIYVTGDNYIIKRKAVAK
jgi:hypothetical protein